MWFLAEPTVTLIASRMLRCRERSDVPWADIPTDGRTMQIDLS
jgi:hypothetical protein